MHLRRDGKPNVLTESSLHRQPEPVGPTQTAGSGASGVPGTEPAAQTGHRNPRHSPDFGQ